MEIGDVINNYSVVSHINAGGMGEVYKVVKDGNEYAMKTLPTNAGDEDRSRFRREVRMLSGIHDEHVIEIIDSDINSSNPFYIMPLCSVSLQEESNRMSSEQKIDACIDFCKGINAIHEAGMYHRDIKPSNAMFLNGVLKIIDLGGGRQIDRDTTTLTQYGQVIYSSGYVPPEFLRDPEAFKKGTRQGDIYMVGKTIYYVMSGGGDVTNVDLTHVEAGVAPVIERCLKENLNERYDSVADVISDLEAFKTAQAQLQNTPKPFNDIMNEPAPSRYDDLYILLLSASSDERELYDLLRQISRDTLTELFNRKVGSLNHYIDTYDQILRNPVGMIQFPAVDVYVNTIRSMVPICQSIYHKQKLIELAIDLSKDYNRYPAMQIVGQILGELPDSVVMAMGAMFVRRKEDLKEMQPNFNTRLHFFIRNLLR